MKNTSLLRVLIVIWLLVGSGIVYSNDAVMSLIYSDQPKVGYESYKKSIDCRFLFQHFVDDRQNKITLGATPLDPIMSLGIDDWFSAASADLLNPHIIPELSPEAVDVVVTPHLTRLYAYVRSTHLYGVTALTMYFSIPGEKTVSKRYRGLGSTRPWGSYHTAINRSITWAYIDIVNDLPTVCDQLLGIERDGVEEKPGSLFDAIKNYF
ncbi:MAG: hypothetical protein COC04_04525 [Gammaproteobacteria bacterium]|nr:MAG: hypothetical protein COC04_04525 [Gammaproteobacteria bacterium]